MEKSAGAAGPHSPNDWKRPGIHDRRVDYRNGTNKIRAERPFSGYGPSAGPFFAACVEVHTDARSLPDRPAGKADPPRLKADDSQNVLPPSPATQVGHFGATCDRVAICGWAGAGHPDCLPNTAYPSLVPNLPPPPLPTPPRDPGTPHQWVQFPDPGPQEGVGGGGGALPQPLPLPPPPTI